MITDLQVVFEGVKAVHFAVTLKLGTPCKDEHWLSLH